MSGISKSQVSKLCREIDERGRSFLDRPLAGDWPYLWLDATYLKLREGGRIIAVAVIVASNGAPLPVRPVNTDGRREIIGLGVGPSEAAVFWIARTGPIPFELRGLVRRGLKGVKLVIADAHEGVKAAIAKVLGSNGAQPVRPCQRCRVHVMRNVLGHIPRSHHAMVAAAIRQVFAQPDRAAAGELWRHVTDQLRPRFPRLATLMEGAEHDVLADLTFPAPHRTKLHSTNPLERLIQAIKRRTDVVGQSGGLARFAPRRRLDRPPGRRRAPGTKRRVAAAAPLPVARDHRRDPSRSGASRDHRASTQGGLTRSTHDRLSIFHHLDGRDLFITCQLRRSQNTERYERGR